VVGPLVVAAREMGATPASDGEGEDGRVVSATAVGATVGVAREAEAAATILPHGAMPPAVT